MQEIDAENEAQQRKDVREEIQARKRDNRRQINEVVTLIERHNIF